MPEEGVERGLTPPAAKARNSGLLCRKQVQPRQRASTSSARELMSRLKTVQRTVNNPVDRQDPGLHKPIATCDGFHSRSVRFPQGQRAADIPGPSRKRSPRKHLSRGTSNVIVRVESRCSGVLRAVQGRKSLPNFGLIPPGQNSDEAIGKSTASPS